MVHTHILGVPACGPGKADVAESGFGWSWLARVQSDDHAVCSMSHQYTTSSLQAGCRPVEFGVLRRIVTAAQIATSSVSTFSNIVLYYKQ
jgi:hypothetical protein